MMKKPTSINKTTKEDGAGSSGLPLVQKESSSTKTLAELMMEKLLVEESIMEADGVLTEEHDIIWQQTDVAVKDKLDNYGYLLDELNAEKKKLQDIKSSGVDRVQAAVARIENLQKKLKTRLNFLAEGESLRGHMYSFHPYLSKKAYINDVEKLSANETYLTIEIRQDYWEMLTTFNAIPNDIIWNIKKKVGKVSELSDNHSAVMTVLTPSVRVS